MTIAPSGRRSRTSWVHLLVFSASAMIGGVVSFGLASGIGAFIAVDNRIAAMVVVVGFMWIATWQATNRTFPPLPYRHGQVPRRWSLSLRGTTTFGGVLGLGIATNVTTGLVHFGLVLSLLSGDISTGIMAGMGFGLGRSSLVALAVLLPNYPREPTSFMKFLEHRLPQASRLGANLALLALSAVMALTIMTRA